MSNNKKDARKDLLSIKIRWGDAKIVDCKIPPKKDKVNEFIDILRKKLL